jgi:hypothetical protein
MNVPGLCVLRWLDRKVTDWLSAEFPSFEQALVDAEEQREVWEPFDLLDGTPLNTDGYRKWPKAEFDDGRVELPREHDLAPRRWRMPNGSIVGEAINRDAVELLKRDPDEYFRRTGHLYWGVDGATSQVEPPFRQQCKECGGLFNVDHTCLRDRASETSSAVVAAAAGEPGEVEPHPPAAPSPGPTFDDIAIPLINEVLEQHHDTRELHIDGLKTYWCECGSGFDSPARHHSHVAAVVAEVLKTALLQHDAAVNQEPA